MTKDVSVHEARRTGKVYNIIHALSLSRMNSEKLRNGIPFKLIVVERSSRRGPCSPAGNISIYTYHQWLGQTR